MELNYQQILAEVYDENAKNILVDQNEYEDEEDAYEEFDYSEHDLEDKEDFNKFHGDRNKPEHVIKPDIKNYNSKSRADVKTIVLNIDGAFRGIPSATPGTQNGSCGLNTESSHPGTLSSHYVLQSHKLYRNITSVKLTSMEFMNSFYTFSTVRGNRTFTINVSGTDYIVKIREGSYTPATLVTEISNVMSALGLTIIISYDGDIDKFIFKGSGGEIITFPSTTTNPYGNGIGYNLGFQNTVYTILAPQLESDSAPNLIQDRYVYLQINDWNLVEHQQYGQTSFPVFAKIQLTGAKNTVIFDSNYLNSSTKEYVFHQPVNIQRLEIRMLDAYGTTLDLRGGVFSMTLELQQVNSSAVYEDLIKTL